MMSMFPIRAEWCMSRRLSTPSNQVAWMRPLWFRLPLALLLATLTGCPTATSTPSSAEKVKPFAGQKLTIVAPTGLPLTATWELLLEEWSAQTGGTIVWEVPSSTATTSATPESAPTATGTAGARLVFFPLDELPQIERRWSLAPFPDELAESHLINARDLPAGLRDRVLSRQRKVIAWPLAAPVLACYYRRDLLEQAKLNVPTTWEDYERLVASVDSWAPGLTAVEPLSAETRGLTFAAHAAATKAPDSLSFWWDLDSGTCLLRQPNFEQSWRQTCSTWRRLSSTCGQLTPSDCRREVLEGRAAIALAWEPTGEYPPLRSAPSRPAGAETSSSGTGSIQAIQRREGIQLGIAPLPGGRKYYHRGQGRWESLKDGLQAPCVVGGTGFAVAMAVDPQLSTDDPAGPRAMMLNLLTMLLKQRPEQVFVPGIPVSPCWEGVHTLNPPTSELTTEEWSAYVDAQLVSLRSTQTLAEFSLPHAAEFRAALANALSFPPPPDVEATGVLEQAEAAFTKIAAERFAPQTGDETFVDAYRRGLGLAKSRRSNRP